jgi:predicted ATP-dependent endonuclease of OLD family
MKLIAFEYSQFENQLREWKIVEEFSLNDINLFVGQNATGKSRLLSVISGLSDIFSRLERVNFKSGKYKATFLHDDKEMVYSLYYEDSQIISEYFYVNGELLLERNADGIGRIKSYQFNDYMNVQVENNVAVVFTKRDPIQHPFLEYVYQWGLHLLYYQFASSLGKDQVTAFVKKDKEQDINLRDFRNVTTIFKKGSEKFSDRFANTIINDMKYIGYDLEEIKIGPAYSINISTSLNTEPYVILVRESGLASEIDQFDMSLGMFRALSIIIQINYSLMAKKTSCILIDDIGEGLDYERSVKLIDIIMHKAKENSIQLLMATNDRFVMNKVPFKYWCLLDREGNQVKVFNYANSRDLFDKFEAKGLNNFDLLTSKYYKKK